MTNEPTIQDVLDALSLFSTHVDQELGSLKTDIGSLKTELGSIKTEMGSLKTDLGSLKSIVVTKDYLDDKLADLRADLVVLARKGNTKLSTLVEELVAEKSLDPRVAQRILLLEPFPQTT